jgi:hypothetical protein
MKKILMGSLVITVFALASLLFQMTSCKKANAQTPATNYPIQGLWTGTYTVDGSPSLGSQYFSFIIKPDGTMINDTKYLGVQNLAPGTWTLSGHTLSCTYTNVYGQSAHIGVTETSTATWDETGTLTTGIWQNTSPLSGSGTFTLTRVN